MPTTRIGLETDLDKSIYTVADSICRCRLAIKMKQCSSVQCPVCSTGKRIERIYNTFTELDRTAIDNLADDLFAKKYYLIKHSAAGETVIQGLMKAVGWLVMFIVVMGGLFIFVSIISCSPCYAQSKYDSSILMPGEGYSMLSYRQGILNVLKKVNEYKQDVNGDGLVNCIDAALLFKTFWDVRFDTGDCELVHNYNPNYDEAHLFVRVRQGYFSKWEYIEPQAYGYDSYFMEDIWGARYIPKYNTCTSMGNWIKWIIQWRKLGRTQSSQKE